MQASSNIRFERMSRDDAKPLSLKLGEQTKGMHWKYEAGSYEFLLTEYFHCFKYLEHAGYKTVLDFGCGTGMSRIVYEMYDWDFDLELYDLDTSWATNEKYLFDYVHKLYNIKAYRMSNLLNDDFKFHNGPDKKYDAVITMRFPPLSQLEISIEDFKKKLAPYTTEDFSLIYYNISPLYKKAPMNMPIWRDENTKPKFIWYDNRVGFMDL